MTVTGSTRGWLLVAASAVALSLSSAGSLAAQTMPTKNDPRVGLRAGAKDFAEVAKGMRLVSLSPKPVQFDSSAGLAFANSDLAFRGNYVYQGNFRGFVIWDVTNKASPTIVNTTVCSNSQGDPSIFGNLLFISAEGSARLDCGSTNFNEASQRLTGIRIWDVSNPRAPRLVKNVNNCKGSHTHTLVPSQTDRNIVYIYISGGDNPRTDLQGQGCELPPEDPNSYYHRLDIIKVDVRNPQAAAVIGGAKVFENFTATPPRYTLPAFVVPFLFTLSTTGLGLLMRGSPLLILWAVFTTMLGIAASAVALGGWAYGPLNVAFRLVIGITSLLFFSGQRTAVLVGGAIAVFVAVMLQRRNRIAEELPS